MALRLKDKEGYPLTPEQFRESESRCVKIIINNEDIPAFEIAAYRSYVRFIRVDHHLKETNPPGQTKFFTRHILEEDLFRFGKYFQKEKEKINLTLKSEIIGILEYFEYGLSDVEEGSGEKQSKLKEIRSILKKLK